MKSFKKTFRRIEKKYILNKAQYTALMEYLQTIAKIDDYGLTNIRNIYYDTPDYRLIRASIEKPVYKEKLRLRTYGAAGDRTKAFIELKKKFDHVVYKRRIGMPYKEAALFLDGKMHVHDPAETSQIGQEISYFLNYYKDLAPRMVITYDRIAMAGIVDPDFRVTFDTNIRWRTDDLDLRHGNSGKRVLPENLYLMELKIAGAVPFELAHKMSTLGIFGTSFSKYGTAYKHMMAENAAASRIPTPGRVWNETAKLAESFG